MNAPQFLNARLLVIALWVLFLIVAVIIIGPGNILSSYGKLTPEGIRDFVISFGVMAVLAYLLISTVRPFFFLPITPFTIASGFIFGPVWGLVAALAGSMIAALVTFLLSRYLLRDYVSATIEKRYPEASHLTSGRGWQYVLFLRVMPVVPYDWVGYIAGASTVNPSGYVAASFAGELPGAVILVLLGNSLLNTGSVGFYVLLILALVLLTLPEVARRVLFRKS